jgi:isoleucyl-tRNA synthetase
LTDTLAPFITLTQEEADNLYRRMKEDIILVLTKELRAQRLERQIERAVSAEKLAAYAEQVRELTRIATANANHAAEASLEERVIRTEWNAANAKLAEQSAKIAELEEEATVRRDANTFRRAEQAEQIAELQRQLNDLRRTDEARHIVWRKDEARIEELTKTLECLRIDANRLCDRMLGGTYEEDCRRTLALVETVQRRKWREE